MVVIGCDPGYEKSAVVAWDATWQRIILHVEDTNERVLDGFRARTLRDGSVLVIEQIESMGMSVGKTTFETVRWAGRFEEAFFPNRVALVTRRVIKLHHCGHSTAKDANIRQALIDRFGPSTEKAIGTKKAQGPLYGISKHEWSALAVALTWADQHAGEATGPVIRPGVTAEF